MKIDLKELKKAIQWVEANTNAVSVKVSNYDNRYLEIRTTDNHGQAVEIRLHSESNLMAKIIKAENL